MVNGNTGDAVLKHLVLGSNAKSPALPDTKAILSIVNEPALLLVTVTAKAVLVVRGVLTGTGPKLRLAGPLGEATQAGSLVASVLVPEAQVMLSFKP